MPSSSHSSGGASGPNITSRWSLQAGQQRHSVGASAGGSVPDQRAAQHRECGTAQALGRAPEGVGLAKVLHYVLAHGGLWVKEEHRPMHQPLFVQVRLLLTCMGQAARRDLAAQGWQSEVQQNQCAPRSEAVWRELPGAAAARCSRT